MSARWYWLKVLLLAVIYMALAKLSLLYFSLYNGNVSLIWPSSGIALAALLIGGRKLWPGVYLGAFATGLMVGDSFWVSAFIALGNTLETLIARELLTLNRSFNLALQRPGDYVRLSLIGGVSVLASVVVGVGTLGFAGIVPKTVLPNAALNWWQADTFGIVAITPLLLVWKTLPQSWFTRERAIETLMLLTLLLLTGQVLFGGWFSDSLGNVVDSYWMFLFLAWIAVRLGLHGVTLGLTTTALQALSGISDGIGYFAQDFQNTHLLNFWFYQLSLSFVSISLALVMRERELALKESNDARRVIAKAEKTYRTLFETVGQGVVYMDTAGRVISANPVAERILGYTMAQMQGRNLNDPCWQTVHEDGSPFADEQHPVMYALNTGKPIHGVVMGIRNPHQAHQVWVKLSAVPIFKEGSKQLDFAYATIDDITVDLKWEKALQESETRLKLALSAGHQGWFELDLKTGDVTVSEEYPKMLGYEPSTFKSSLAEWKQNLYPEDREAVLSLLNECISSNEPKSMDYRRRKANGDWLWINSVAKVTAWDENHRPLRLVGTHTDISERKKASEELEFQKEYLKSIFDTEPECVKVVSPDGELLDMNGAGLRMLEIDSLEEAKKLGLLSFVDSQYQQGFIQLHQSVMKGQSGTLEFLIKGNKGKVRWLETHATPLRDKQGNVISLLGVARDITEHKLFQQTLEKQARFDYLTGLNNRGFFMQLAEAELARAIRYESDLTVFMLDIDLFKKINDTHGHKAGDLVLKKLAEICKQMLREVDIIGRVGGEEFAVLLPETNVDGGAEVAERLREAIEGCNVPISEGLPLSFNVSIGVTSLFSQEENLDVLLARADKALYLAKESGRNKIHVIAQNH